jgi:hypothetical protein
MNNWAGRSEAPKMPLKRWLVQYIAHLPVLAFTLGGLQYLRGRALDYSVDFGLIWGAICASIFLATRIYYYRKGLYCKICNDYKPPEDKT